MERKAFNFVNTTFYISAILALSACDALDSSVSNASEIIKNNLQSPSSFSLFSGKQVWQGTTSTDNPAYIVRIEYDAQNGFGAMLRDCKLVSYYTDGNSIKWKSNTALNECDGKPLFDESHMIEYSRLANFDK